MTILGPNGLPYVETTREQMPVCRTCNGTGVLFEQTTVIGPGFAYSLPSGPAEGIPCPACGQVAEQPGAPVADLVAFAEGLDA